MTNRRRGFGFVCSTLWLKLICDSASFSFSLPLSIYLSVFPHRAKIYMRSRSPCLDRFTRGWQRTFSRKYIPRFPLKSGQVNTRHLNKRDIIIYIAMKKYIYRYEKVFMMNVTYYQRLNLSLLMAFSFLYEERTCLHHLHLIRDIYRVSHFK